MSNLVAVQSSDLAYGLWDSQQLEVIKQQIAKDCTDHELALFGQVCGRTGLDPFAKQIYAIKRGGKNPQMSIQTSIDGFRLIADRTGKYDGSETFWCGADGVWRDVWLASEYPAAAKTVIYKKGSERAFSAIALWNDFKQEKDAWENGKPTGEKKLTDFWAKMPTLMLGKVSESQALRKAFPNELSGLYTREEMIEASAPIDVEVLPPQSSATTAPVRSVPDDSFITQPQRTRMWAIATKAGWTKEGLQSYIFAEHGVASGKEITMAMYDPICAYVKDPDAAKMWNEIAEKEQG